VAKKGKKGGAKITPIETVTKVSEDGYRIKKIQVGGEVIEENKTEDELDCLERRCKWCYARCWKKCCKKKLKKAKVLSQESEFSGGGADPSLLTIGCSVKLFGLSQAQYNGLTGKIVSAANEKGRFEVDVTVLTDDSLEEHKFVSFKPENMRIVAGDAWEEKPAEEPAAKPSGKRGPIDASAEAAFGNSYRSGR